MIPRTIHQTFINTVDMPEVFKSNIEHIKRLNPSWQHILYGEEQVNEFVRTEGWPELVNQYNRLQLWISKIDVFKYLLIYKKGGLYLDVKSTLNKPLDSVLLESDQYILSQWLDTALPETEKYKHHTVFNNVPGGEYQQWFIAAAPGHPYLKKTLELFIENAKAYTSGSGKYPTLALSGPIPYTLAIHSIKDQYPHREVMSYSDLGFQYSVYNDFTSHVQHFPDHYSLSVLPLVR